MLVGKPRRDRDSVDYFLSSDVLLPETDLLLRLQFSSKLTQINLRDGRQQERWQVIRVFSVAGAIFSIEPVAHLYDAEHLDLAVLHENAILLAVSCGLFLFFVFRWHPCVRSLFEYTIQILTEFLKTFIGPLARAQVHLARKRVLQGMHGFVRSSGSTPTNFLKVAKIELVYDTQFEKRLLDLALDGADVRILLRAAEIRPIVAHYQGDAAFGRQSRCVLAFLVQIGLFASLQLTLILFLLDGATSCAFFEVFNTLFCLSFHF